MKKNIKREPIVVKLWDYQVRSFQGWVWPKDQHGQPMSWEPPWLYLYGPPGSGKSEYARWWVNQWEGWEFVNVNALIDTLRAASGNKLGVRSHIEKLSTAHRVVIDDLGNEPRDFFNNMGTRYTPTEILETAMFRRHESGLRTLITSNLSPYPGEGKRVSSFEKVYGPKMQSRLMEFAKIYNMQGDIRDDEIEPSDVVVELINNPPARSPVPLLPQADAGYYEFKEMTKEQFQASLKTMTPAGRRVALGMYNQFKAKYGKKPGGEK